MAKTFLICGSLGMFLAVGLGAFAAHALKTRLSAEMFSVFEVAVRYHVYHALALLFLALLQMQLSSINFSPVGYLFIFGTILFSGSLYVLACTSISWFGAITPVGGLCFLAGWLLLASKIFRSF